MKIPFLLWVVLLTAGLAPNGRAYAEPLDLHYDASVVGLPVVSLDFHVEEGDGLYRIHGDAATEGIANILFHFHMIVQSEGGIAGGVLSPSVADTVSLRRSGRREIRLDYHDGAVKTSLIPTPSEADRETLPADTANTFNPLAAILSAAHQFAATGRCDMRIKIFDGHRRYDWVFSDLGEETIDSGAFSGKARHCTLVMEHGHGMPYYPEVQDAPSENPANHHNPADVWLAPPRPGADPLPVRLKFHSAWGGATIRLAAIGPAEAKSGATHAALP